MYAEFKPKKYLFSLTTVFVTSLVSLSLILVNVDPQKAGVATFFFFYLSLFLFAVAGFTVFGYIFRIWLSRNSPLAFFANISLRQGILLGFLLSTVLFLQSLRALTLLSVLLLLLSLILLEIAFLTR